MARRGKLPLEEIASQALRGIESAFRKYERMSGGYWLSYAPECYIQAEIANALAKKCPIVTLEDNVGEILKNSGADRRGAKPRGSRWGRVDIVVWWKNDSPRTLMEVKKITSATVLNDDAKRLRRLLKKKDTGSFAEGLLVGYADAPYKEKIDERFADIEANTGSELYRRLTPRKSVENGMPHYWDAACFLLK